MSSVGQASLEAPSPMNRRDAGRRLPYQAEIRSAGGAGGSYRCRHGDSWRRPGRKQRSRRDYERGSCPLGENRRQCQRRRHCCLRTRNHLDDDVLDELIASSLVGPIWATRHAVRHLDAGGFVVSVSGVIAETPVAGKFSSPAAENSRSRLHITRRGLSMATLTPGEYLTRAGSPPSG